MSFQHKIKSRHQKSIALNGCQTSSVRSEIFVVGPALKIPSPAGTTFSFPDDAAPERSFCKFDLWFYKYFAPNGANHKSLWEGKASPIGCDAANNTCQTRGLF
jgi:hypothetical protein